MSKQNLTTLAFNQYHQYENILIFAKEWRKYKQVSDVYDSERFRKEIQASQHVKIEFFDEKIGRPVFIFLLSADSNFTVTAQYLKKLLVHIRNPSDIIIIAREPLRNYAQKAMRTFKHLRIKVYLHENFDLIVPNGPLCYPHRILSHEEIQRLLNEELFCYLINLPKILLEDVQCIWIGAEVGDVVETTMLSDIAGETVQYRVVVPKSGKITSFRQDSVDVVVENDDEDEDIQEHRENAAIDKEDIDDEELE